MELDVPELEIYAQKPKMVFGHGRHLTIFPIEKGKVSPGNSLVLL